VLVAAKAETHTPMREDQLNPCMMLLLLLNASTTCSSDVY
jgi:hypothetical protein